MGLRAAGAVGSLTLGSREVFLIGYGPGAKRRTTVEPDSLRLRAILLEDDAGDRVALISGDLWSASAAVLRHLGATVKDSPTLKLDASRIFFSGTHTHCSLGGLYESPYYATYASDYWVSKGFDPDLVDAVASHFLSLLYEAEGALEPATVERGVASFGGHSINRSYSAYVRNALPGTNPDPGADEATQRSATNPAVKLVRFRSVADPAKVLGVWGAVNCHATSLGKSFTRCSGDFIGTASARLEGPAADAAPWVLCAGAVGDVDPQPAGLSRADFIQARDSGDAAALAHMSALASALEAAVRTASYEPPAAVNRLRALRVQAFATSAQVPSGRLPALPMIGDPVLAGSELGPGPCSQEGARDNGPNSSPQWPKLQQNPFAQLANNEVKLHTPFLPLSVFAIGDAMWLVGLPGEPSTVMARSIEERLRPHAAGAELMVCGVNGDYSGYFVTAKEYEAQNYEGASCLWGRLTQEFLLAQLEGLVAVPAVGAPAMLLAAPATAAVTPMAAAAGAPAPAPAPAVALPPAAPTAVPVALGAVPVSLAPAASAAAAPPAEDKAAKRTVKLMRTAPRAEARPRPQKSLRAGKSVVVPLTKVSPDREVLLEVRVGPHVVRLRPADRRKLDDGRWSHSFVVDQRLLKFEPALVAAPPVKKKAPAPPG